MVGNQRKANQIICADSKFKRMQHNGSTTHDKSYNKKVSRHCKNEGFKNISKSRIPTLRGDINKPLNVSNKTKKNLEYVPHAYSRSQSTQNNLHVVQDPNLIMPQSPKIDIESE